MGARLRARGLFVALALCTIALGLVIHWRGQALPATVRDVSGDALWAMMIFWWIAAVAPSVAVRARGAVAYVVCAAVETSQLYQGAGIDALRRTTIGELVLGSGFDPRDFFAYALGVLLAMLVEHAVTRLRSS